jgi:hypothetical protein
MPVTNSCACHVLRTVYLCDHGLATLHDSCEGTVATLSAGDESCQCRVSIEAMGCSPPRPGEGGEKPAASHRSDPWHPLSLGIASIETMHYLAGEECREASRTTHSQDRHELVRLSCPWYCLFVRSRISHPARFHGCATAKWSTPRATSTRPRRSVRPPTRTVPKLAGAPHADSRW